MPHHGIEIKLPTELLKTLWPGPWPPYDYLPLWIDRPNIYATHSLQPCEHTLWDGHASHELILAGNSFHQSHTTEILQRPNQTIALYFVTGGGTMRILGSSGGCREYFYTNHQDHHEQHFWYRVTRRDLGTRKPGSRRAGLARKQNDRLHLPIAHCDRLNHPVIKPTIEQAIAHLWHQSHA